MFNFLRVAAAAPRTKTAQIRLNAEEIIRVVRKAKDLGVKVLLLPKDVITGAGCGDLLHQGALKKAADEALEHITFETRSCGMVLAIGSDMLLYDFPGSGFSFGSQIFLETEARTAEAGRWQKTRDRLLALSQINNAAYIYASNGPMETVTEGVYGGGLLICENGRVLAERPALTFSLDDEPLMIAADIDRDLLSKKTAPVYPNPPQELNGFDFEYSLLKQDITLPLLRPNPRNPFFPDEKKDYPAFCADIFNIQKTALGRRIAHISAKKAIINVSGGLDSALALLALVGAMDLIGRDRRDILALFLPGFGTTERTAANGRLLAGALGVSSREINIMPSCLKHFEDIGLDPAAPGLAYENAQARERTQVAMDIANMEKGIMIGTGNMSEAALGWSTFGGDHLSMYNPNGALTKTAVREVMTWAAETGLFGDNASKVLLDILNTPISPELLPSSNGRTSQLTEEAVGPYELTDFFLYHMIKNRFTPDKIAFLAELAFEGAYTPQTIRHWLRSFIKRFFANQFKRISAPESPAVFGVSLSPRSGFSMPGDAFCEDWLDFVKE